ncbi:MAG: Crp/Fnr family transcriptional regulator [Tissierellia bacterium]|nr:Crp/Fnr family transcriptional regulator [Tissierellia bacterium]
MLEKLRALMDQKNSAVLFPPGTVLMRPEDPLRELLFLTSGTVEIVSYDGEGRRLIASFLDGPQILGLVELFSGRDRLLSGVVARSAGTYIPLDCGILRQRDPDILRELAVYLAHLNVATMEAAQRSRRLSSYESLKNFLLDHRGEELALKREDLGDLLRIPERSLYRYLNRLEEEGIISRQGGGISILSPKNPTKKGPQ